MLEPLARLFKLPLTQYHAFKVSYCFISKVVRRQLRPLTPSWLVVFAFINLLLCSSRWSGLGA